MHERCPVCGVRFEREPGYFFGAMYFSYALAIPMIAGLTAILALTICRDWQLHWVVLPASAIYLLFVPTVFRYSRVLWMHFDRYFHTESSLPQSREDDK